MRQVGALPWRVSKSGSLRIMLITSRSGRQWIIPKGWPIAGRSEYCSATQEALEEAGVIGIVAAAAIGEFEYATRKEPQMRRRVRVFPLEVRGTLVRWQECAERKRRWFTLEEAVTTVSNNDLAALIQASSSKLSMISG
ncbi:NUDIX hydrolase [Rhizobium sp. Root149]|uniref:NUDIX hydrolase n=1 Tax=Rhizobium sp. Root149 TaxID=1736473 RepID=UPI0012E36021|nr:NUDIX hydrolase [Rhizobium sp. Root149]